LSSTRENEGCGMIGGGKDTRRDPRLLEVSCGEYGSYGCLPTGGTELKPSSLPGTVCGSFGYEVLNRRFLFSAMLSGVSSD
jgi:hypothetical protein